MSGWCTGWWLWPSSPVILFSMIFQTAVTVCRRPWRRVARELVFLLGAIFSASFVLAAGATEVQTRPSFLNAIGDSRAGLQSLGDSGGLAAGASREMLGGRGKALVPPCGEAARQTPIDVPVDCNAQAVSSAPGRPLQLDSWLSMGVGMAFLLLLLRSWLEVRVLKRGFAQCLDNLLQQREAEFCGLGDNACDLPFRYDRNCRRVADWGEVEQRQSQFFNLAPGVFASVELAADGRFIILFASPGIGDLFGLAADSFERGVSPLVVFNVPADRAMALGKIGESASRLTPLQLEWRTIHPQKGLRWIELSALPQRLPNGSVRWDGFAHDITERKQMEEALARREREFRMLANNLPNHIARFDAAGRYCYANPALQEFMGVSDEEQYIGKTLEEVDCDGVTRRLAGYIQRAIVSGTPLETEFMIDRPGSDPVCHQIRIVPEFDANGECSTVLVVGWDISQLKRYEAEREATKKRLREQNALLQANQEALEQRVAERTAELGASNRMLSQEIEMRKQTESRLQQAKEFAEGIINAIPDRLFEISAEGRFLNVWAQNAELLVVRKEALLGRTLHEIHSPEAATIVMSAIGEAAETGYSFGKIISIPFSHGRRWFELSVARKPGSHSAIDSFIVLSRDITERKQAEESVVIREREFRTLAENLPDNIIRYDAAGRRTYLNPAALRLLGGEAELFIGQTPEESYAGCGWPPGKISRVLRGVLASGKPDEVAITLGTSLQEQQIHSLRFVAERNAQGGIEGALLIGRDISDLKRTEREREESRRQLRGFIARRDEVLEAERKRIAREVHDELGQILTGLQMNVSRLARKYTTNSPAAHEQVQEALRLTEKALAVARNVASALRPAVFDMGIAVALEWLAGRFGTNTGIRCHVHIGEGDIELNESQAIALFRITQESLTNVARHAHADRVDITLARSAADYVLKIRDNGIGFDGITSKPSSFGLVGIRERALMLGGVVEFDGRLGCGTEIVVRIPV